MLLYNATTLLDEMGDRERAVRYLYKSLEGDEQMEDAYNYWACYWGSRSTAAVQVLTGSIKIHERSYKLYFNRGIVLGNVKKARRLVLSAKRHTTNNRDQALITILPFL